MPVSAVAQLPVGSTARAPKSKAVLAQNSHPLLQIQVAGALPGAGDLQMERQGSWGIQWGGDPMTFAVQHQVSLCQPEQVLAKL